MEESKLNNATKIFFGCSMRGNYPFVNRKELSIIPEIIEELGFYVISKHQTTEDILIDEYKMSSVHIHDRDYNWLIQAQAGIFEISNPSLGVGGEITDLSHMGKPILLLYKRDVADIVSAYIVGKANSKYVNCYIETQEYADIFECKTIISNFIAKILKKNDQ